ncbi:MAG: hypothetical protein U0Q18_09200 [Bryobacteraceae bacterium]
MKILIASSALSMLLLCSQAGFAAGRGNAAAAFPLTYEGGTLGLNHHKVKATIGSDALTFSRGSRRLTVPAKNITEISCGNGIHGRYYVGVGWTASGQAQDKPSRGEVVLKLSAAEYREFVAALEKLTGLKAVDATRTPTVVRYEL